MISASKSQNSSLKNCLFFVMNLKITHSTQLHSLQCFVVFQISFIFLWKITSELALNSWLNHIKKSYSFQVICQFRKMSGKRVKHVKVEYDDEPLPSGASK